MVWERTASGEGLPGMEDELDWRARLASGAAALRALAARWLSGRPLALPRLALLVALPLGLLTLLLPGLWVDPFLRAPSLAALAGDMGPARAATRASGAWLAHLWALGAADLPLSWHLALFHGLSALAAAAVALSVFHQDAVPGRALLAAVALLVAPHLSGWALDPVAMVPAAAVVALFALVCVVAPPGRVLAAAVPAAAAGLLADPAVPVILLAVLLVAGPIGRGRSALLPALGAVLLGAAIGVAAAFGLNLALEGAVGVAPAAAAADPVATAGAWLLGLAARLLGPEPLLGGGVVALAVGALFLRAPRRGDRVLVGLGAVVATGFALAFLSGRAPSAEWGTALWILGVGALAWAARLARHPAVGAAFLAALGLAALQGLSAWHDALAAPRAYQAASAGLAREIAEGVPDAAGPIVLAGNPGSVTGAEVLAEFGALARRIGALTGRATVQCPGASPLCARHRGAMVRLPERPIEGWVAPGEGGATLVRLPDGVFAPAAAR